MWDNHVEAFGSRLEPVKNSINLEASHCQEVNIQAVMSSGELDILETQAC